MTKTKKLVLTALFISIGIVLPQMLAPVPSVRAMLSPMHIPALLCGLIAGPSAGLVTGLVVPLLSHLIFGMPMAGMLPGMVIELGTYGLAAGLAMKMKKISFLPRVYVSLILAMLAGRITAGLVNAFVIQVGKYSRQTWIVSYFIGTAPAMVIQIIVIPLLVMALVKAHLIQK